MSLRRRKSRRLVQAATERTNKHVILADDNTAYRTLTPKQSEILRLVAQGMTTPQIAVALGSSPATIRTHVGNILARLGAHTRAQAVAMMLQEEGPA